MFSLIPTSPNKGWLISSQNFRNLARRVLTSQDAPRGGMIEDAFADELEELNASRALQTDPSAPGFAFLKVEGVIYYGATPLEEMFYGLYNLARLEEALRIVASTPTIKVLGIQFETPGGYTTAVKENAAAIAALSQSGTTVLGFTSELCASAGYYLAAACNSISTTPFADLGSIGVYNVIVDDSEFYKQMGLSIEYVRDGDYKAMGAPGKAWTDKEKEMIRDGVEKISIEFKSFVATHRPEVTAAQMQGQCFTASDPAAQGLADFTDFTSAEEFIAHAARVASL